MKQVMPTDAETVTPDAESLYNEPEQTTMGAQPPKSTAAVNAWISVHTSKPYTSCMAQRILAQVEQNVAEFAEEVLYRSGAAAVETGPALGTR
jgi:hypothetical protein